MRHAALHAGDVAYDAWCARCMAQTVIRIPLHAGSPAGPLAATVEVCAECGNYRIPRQPVVTVEPGPRWQFPRLILAARWRLARRAAELAGREAKACAYGACARPGHWDCGWYEAVDGGRIRWVFCGARHRRRWLRER